MTLGFRPLARLVGGLFFVVFVVGGGKLFAGACNIAARLGADDA